MDIHRITKKSDEDGILRIELPIGKPNAEVEIVIILQPVNQTGKTINRMQQVRKKHPRAYEPWTDEEEAKILELEKQGLSTKEIAEAVQRQPGAISSRLSKIAERGTDQE